MFAEGQLIDTMHENFLLSWSEKITLGELESMLPWERDAYIAMFIRKLNEEKENLNNG
ncbi:baseplate hub assembly catalyst [Vibrio phage EniLVp02]